VEIPGFDSSQVEGVWIWHATAEDGSFRRSVEVVIDDVEVVDNVEVVHYSVLDKKGEPRLQLPARLERDELDPDTVQIQFVIMLLDGDGFLRASTYNTAGESGLSAETLLVESV
jgi:hypothetical protein